MKGKALGTSALLVVVQEVLIRWYKDERGSNFARERTALPHALELPKVIPQERTACLYQLCQPYVKDGVLCKSEKIEEFDTLFQDVSRSIRLKRDDEELIVYLHPRRIGITRKSVTLRLGEWLQFRWNERVPYESTWGYEDRTLNIGFLVGKELSSDYFLTRPPDKSFSELVQLY